MQAAYYFVSREDLSYVPIFYLRVLTITAAKKILLKE